MAQHDYIIDNQPGASFRADLNSALAAIVSNNSGATAPTTTYPFQWWADTTAGVLKQRDASNSEWQDVYPLGGGLVSQTGPTGAAILPEGTDAERPVPGETGLYVRLNAEAGKPEWYNREVPAWKKLVDEDQLGVLDAQVQALDAAIGFTILYPNGGSAGSPATVSTNSRYSMPNPFPGKMVAVEAQIEISGNWGPSGWDGNSGSGSASYGVSAGHLTNASGADLIIVQTGSVGVAVSSNLTGGVHGYTGAAIAAANCRVIVRLIKG